jgi:hypothetical protein
LSVLVALSFSKYNFALMFDITIVTNYITRMICCRQPDEVRGRDDYSLKNISTVVEFSLSLPGTNAAGERVFSLVNALWADERNRLEVLTAKSIGLVKHHFRKYKCPEF